MIGQGFRKAQESMRQRKKFTKISKYWSEEHDN